MPRRPAPEPLSPRALARLRAGPRSFVPTALDLDGPAQQVESSGGPEVRSAGNRAGDRGVGSGRADAVAAPDRSRPGRRAPTVDTAPARGGRHTRRVHPRGPLRLPAAFVGARWQPGRGAVVGIVIVAALAAAVFGLRVAWARSSGEGTVIAPGGGSRAGPTGVTAGAVPVGVGGGARGASGGAGTPSVASTATASPGASGSSTAAGVVVVHVVGQVKHPGVRRLPVGSRVTDALEAAGGATRKADLGRLNLARVLVDGEQVRVPAPGDPVDPSAPSGPGGTGGGSAGGGSGGAGAPVSLNTADLVALDTLPGVGPVLAQRIVDWRTAHGRFTSVDELGEVSGIGEKLLAQLTPLVTL